MDSFKVRASSLSFRVLTLGHFQIIFLLFCIQSNALTEQPNKLSKIATNNESFLHDIAFKIPFSSHARVVGAIAGSDDMPPSGISSGERSVAFPMAFSSSSRSSEAPCLRGNSISQEMRVRSLAPHESSDSPSLRDEAPIADTIPPASTELPYWTSFISSERVKSVGAIGRWCI